MAACLNGTVVFCKEAACYYTMKGVPGINGCLFPPAVEWWSQRSLTPQFKEGLPAIGCLLSSNCLKEV